MDLIRIVDENNEIRYVNKDRIMEIHEDKRFLDRGGRTPIEEKVTVVVFSETCSILTKESLEDLYKRLVFGWK